MASFLFYDPSRRHSASQIDSDIVYIHDRNNLDRLTAANNRVPQVLCVCCPDQSTIINAMLRHQHIVSIYVCKEHGEREENPLFSPRVCRDIWLTPDTSWEFKGRLALLGECMKRGYNEQTLNELQRLRNIEKRFLDRFPSSVEAVDYQ